MKVQQDSNLYNPSYNRMVIQSKNLNKEQIFNRKGINYSLNEPKNTSVLIYESQDQGISNQYMSNQSANFSIQSKSKNNCLLKDINENLGLQNEQRYSNVKNQQKMENNLEANKYNSSVVNRNIISQQKNIQLKTKQFLNRYDTQNKNDKRIKITKNNLNEYNLTQKMQIQQIKEQTQQNNIYVNNRYIFQKDKQNVGIVQNQSKSENKFHQSKFRSVSQQSYLYSLTEKKNEKQFNQENQCKLKSKISLNQQKDGDISNKDNENLKISQFQVKKNKNDTENKQKDQDDNNYSLERKLSIFSNEEIQQKVIDDFTTNYNIDYQKNFNKNGKKSQSQKIKEIQNYNRKLKNMNLNSNQKGRSYTSQGSQNQISLLQNQSNLYNSEKKNQNIKSSLQKQYQENTYTSGNFNILEIERLKQKAQFQQQQDIQANLKKFKKLFSNYYRTLFNANEQKNISDQSKSKIAKNNDQKQFLNNCKQTRSRNQYQNQLLQTHSICHSQKTDQNITNVTDRSLQNKNKSYLRQQSHNSQMDCLDIFLNRKDLNNHNQYDNQLNKKQVNDKAIQYKLKSILKNKAKQINEYKQNDQNQNQQDQLSTESNQSQKQEIKEKDEQEFQDDKNQKFTFLYKPKLVHYSELDFRNCFKDVNQSFKSDKKLIQENQIAYKIDKKSQQKIIQFQQYKENQKLKRKQVKNASISYSNQKNKIKFQQQKCLNKNDFNLFAIKNQQIENQNLMNITSLNLIENTNATLKNLESTASQSGENSYNDLYTQSKQNNQIKEENQSQQLIEQYKQHHQDDLFCQNNKAIFKQRKKIRSSTEIDNEECNEDQLSNNYDFKLKNNLESCVDKQDSYIQVNMTLNTCSSRETLNSLEREKKQENVQFYQNILQKNKNKKEFENKKNILIQQGPKQNMFDKYFKNDIILEPWKENSDDEILNSQSFIHTLQNQVYSKNNSNIKIPQNQNRQNKKSAFQKMSMTNNISSFPLQHKNDGENKINQFDNQTLHLHSNNTNQSDKKNKVMDSQFFDDFDINSYIENNNQQQQIL
ncbi:hypothetical protein PPERSA_06655 [Pseudocohnilembus persalinus]|uniref:Uncharacterized protein n=1 Tax=Pseudocohnilembus persalinus TaxID=266149 RepID=A0A0V0QS55_PSEPJ|nr:hypothetical protein PPERSA_06655 [Pseudocohnilembus persalinus]|eukprot:KRX05021.1 hypothetical protein PPERSA_06655 [Pseudocohnilembus persalinus]